jgi:enoyl-CoA hydratase
MTTGDQLVIERSGESTRVTLNRADRLNSLDTGLLNALAGAIRSADDGATKVVVLTGAGRSFCSGADLSSVVDHSTVAAANEVVRSIATVRPVVIAAINGSAAGVGVSIALACDVTIAAESAFLLVPFLPLGLVPDGGATHTLVSRAGGARAARLAFGGERLSASGAAAWGLVGETVPDDQLSARIDALVDRLLDAPAAAVFETKSLLRRQELDGFERAAAAELNVQSRLLAADEYAIAREGFLAKRRVTFRHG